MILEVCVDSVASAIHAQAGGADRIELCGDLIVGGVTPSLALYEEIRKQTNLPVHVLLRPRFGDFLYKEEELSILMRQAALFAEAGADALVIGCLTLDGRLDLEANARIMEQAKGVPINLHRAFDMCRDLMGALEDARGLGITSILTSGGCASALQGMAQLQQLQQAAGTLHIMAAAGLNADTIGQLLDQTDLTDFHMSGKKIRDSQMQYRNPKVSMGLPSLSEYEIWETDPAAVQAAREILSQALDR